jgi:hypothetical protein
MTPGCPEKLSLMQAYETAVLRYSEAVTALGKAVGAVVFAEYELVQRAVAINRERSEQARESLERHISEHCC